MVGGALGYRAVTTDSDFSLSLFQSQAHPKKDLQGQSPPATSLLPNIPWPCLGFSSEQTHFTTQRRCRKRAFHHREQDCTVFTGRFSLSSQAFPFRMTALGFSPFKFLVFLYTPPSHIYCLYTVTVLRLQS